MHILYVFVRSTYDRFDCLQTYKLNRDFVCDRSAHVFWTHVTMNKLFIWVQFVNSEEFYRHDRSFGAHKPTVLLAYKPDPCKSIHMCTCIYPVKMKKKIDDFIGVHPKDVYLYRTK